jgi:alkanesulfonate monooxygenase SsuD/methylene tetrahydromethanopterin reductase-like flavin-dependent oxidoreductase (luciferase family)
MTGLGSEQMTQGDKLEFGLMCEFRNPKGWQRPFRTRLDELMDAVVWAEEIGYDAVQFTEHHFYDDEYVASPLLLATLAAYRTTRIRIGTSVIILPLYHPVRLAEDAAFIDNISNGRYELGFGVGYRKEEYAGFGVPWEKRGERTDEMIEIISRLWEEDEVTFHGKYYQIEKASLHPRPVQNPRPPILVGGFSRLASRRAARHGDALLIGTDLSQNEVYNEELIAANKSPADGAIYGGKTWTFVSDEPERTWELIAPYAMYHIGYYTAQGASESYFTQDDEGPKTQSLEDFRSSGVMRVLTADEMIAEIQEMASNMNLRRYLYFLNTGMIPADIMRKPLELFAKKVIPAFR